MDDKRFAAWTRRRFGFGLTAGGLAAALVAVVATDEAAVARKRKGKRKTCKPNEKHCGKTCVKGNCCPEKSCGEGCACQRTIGGRRFCIDTGIAIECVQCASNADCEGSLLCVKADCGNSGVAAVCQRPCGFQP